MDGTATATTGTNNPSRRVMVVADPTRESAGALQYALSHAMHENDELILLHVMNLCTWKGTFGLLSSFFRRQLDQPPPDPTLDASIDGGSCDGRGGGNTLDGLFVDGAGGGGRDADFLEMMKRACETMNPKRKVRMEKVEQGSMDKATTILFRTKLLSIDLLIIGQRRNLSNVLLGPRRNGGALLGGSKAMDTAEYLIENSLCACVGVQKKGQKAGYLLNTKTHKNFWLLA